MGNGALPNGLSYRAHPRLYPNRTSHADLPCPFIGANRKSATDRGNDANDRFRQRRRSARAKGSFQCESYGYCTRLESDGAFLRNGGRNKDGFSDRLSDQETGGPVPGTVAAWILELFIFGAKGGWKVGLSRCRAS